MVGEFYSPFYLIPNPKLNPNPRLHHRGPWVGTAMPMRGLSEEKGFSPFPRRASLAKVRVRVISLGDSMPGAFEASAAVFC